MIGLATSIGMAKPMPCASWLTAVLMPMTWPPESSSGPPELPGLMAASVWIRLFSCSELDVIESPATIWRPRPEITPVVTVFSNSPSGLPMAIASCPGLSSELEPMETVGRPLLSTLMMARSVSGSIPYSGRRSSRLSLRRTVSCVAPSTTCLLVRIQPSES